MLGHVVIGSTAICDVPAGEPTPYAVDIDDSPVIDHVNVVILTVFDDPAEV